MYKNRYILRSFAFTMAILLFSTTAGVAMDLHYCGGEYQNFSLFSEAKSCHEIAQAKKSCHHNPAPQEASESEACKDNKNCCDNESFVVQLDEDFIQQGNIDLKNKKIQSPALAHQYLSYAGYVDYTSLYKNYKPPLLDREIHVEIQSFLL